MPRTGNTEVQRSELPATNDTHHQEPEVGAVSKTRKELSEQPKAAKAANPAADPDIRRIAEALDKPPLKQLPSSSGANMPAVQALRLPQTAPHIAWKVLAKSLLMTHPELLSKAYFQAELSIMLCESILSQTFLTYTMKLAFKQDFVSSTF